MKLKNNMSAYLFKNIYSTVYLVVLMVFVCLGFTLQAEAATLSFSPSTGVYQSGKTFTASVVINTEGQSINAAEGTIKFNPGELSVVSVTKGSLFNLWTAEPTFSNSAGTISFSGGNPTGYKGSAGTVLTITFRATGSGSAKTSFGSGAVLAADGRGTNVLSTMGSGNYTISSQTTTPTEEVIIEYVAPANTPGAPVITSTTHSDSSKWYKQKTAELSWKLPAGVTGVRTSLDTSPSGVPTKVYDSPISSISLPDLDEGVSYFHLQFRNADGWGKITHYRLAIDSEAPSAFTLAVKEGSDSASPTQTLSYQVTDESSSVNRFMLQIDGAEAIEYIDSDKKGEIILPELKPGYHTIVVEAFDEAGNGTLATISLTIESFDKPVFTEYPTSIDNTVIPVIKGKTRPQATVKVTFTQVGVGVSSSDTVKTYEVGAGENGEFVVIPDGRLGYGVYELSAIALDTSGAQSDISEIIRIVVEEPGYVRFGTFAISVLSVVIPLLALCILLFVSVWFILVRTRLLKKGVVREAHEAEAMLVREFKELRTLLDSQKEVLIASRKGGKMTKSESDLIDELAHALRESENRVMKEIEDVNKLVE